MVGKLIKAELKATKRLFLPILVAFLFAPALLFTINTIINKANAIELQLPPNNPITMFANISAVIYISLIVGGIAISFAVLIQRFYKYLLGDEGYLMFTLPVPPWYHIIAKGFVAFFWTIITAITTMFSVLILSGNLQKLPSLIDNVVKELNAVSATVGASSIVLGVELLLLFFITVVLVFMEVYTAICIGHLWKSHRLLGTFLSYLGLEILSQSSFVLLTVILPRAGNGPFEGRSLPMILLAGIIGELVFIAIYFLVCKYILTQKLNLS